MARFEFDERQWDLDANIGINIKNAEQLDSQSKSIPSSYQQSSALSSFVNTTQLGSLSKQQTTSPIHFAASLSANITNSSPSSPSTIYIHKPVIQTRQQSNLNFFYQSPHIDQTSLPLTPPSSSTSTRKISFQLGPHGITQINTFNFTPTQLEPQQQATPPPSAQSIIVTSLSKSNHHLRMTPISITTPASPSVLYRTELTITPSTFTQSTTPTYPSTTIPKYLNNNTDKRNQK